MRFIYVLLIGMIVFNGVLFLFSGDFDSDGVSDFFPMSTHGEHAVNVSDNATAKGYKKISSESMIVDAVTAGGGIFLVTVIGAALLKQQVAPYVGVGMFIGLLAGLWVMATSAFSTILDYAIVGELYIIITIGIGIIATITVIEMFTGGGGGN